MVNSPIRIRLSRAKGWRMPPNTVRVARPGPFGNPWGVREYAEEFDQSTSWARERVVAWFREWIEHPNDHEDLDDVGFYAHREEHRILHSRLAELRGKNLACWCALDAPCHADVLLEIANRPLCEEVSNG